MKTKLSKLEQKILADITLVYPVSFQEVKRMYVRCLSFDAVIYQLDWNLFQKAAPKPLGKRMRTDMDILMEVDPQQLDPLFINPIVHSIHVKDALNGMKVLREEFTRIIDNMILQIQVNTATTLSIRMGILLTLRKLKQKI
jgi:hypothetical protein